MQITKANSFIEASYNLSIVEMRVVLIAISKINPREDISDQNFYEVSACEYARFTDTDIKHAYQELKKTITRLWNSSVVLNQSANGEVLPNQIETRIIQSRIKYAEGEGRISIKFSSDIIPYLSQLKSQFTSYHLSEIAGLKKFHHIRIYEMLIQYKSTGKRVDTLEDFRHILGLNRSPDDPASKDKYPLFKDLQKHVIKPSIEAINKHTRLKITCRKRTKARKVTHLEFLIAEKKATKSVAITESELSNDELLNNALDEYKTWQTAEGNISGRNFNILKSILEKQALTTEESIEIIWDRLQKERDITPA